MKDEIVKLTNQWVDENRNIREVRMMKKKKRRKQMIAGTAAWITGFVSVIGAMAWFDVNIPARVATIVALTIFAILALGRDEE